MIQRAGEHERFAPTAFDSQIGKTIPVNLDSGSTPGGLVAAKVSPDGQQVELTVEVDDRDPSAGFIESVGRPMSFGVTRPYEDPLLKRGAVRYKDGLPGVSSL